MTIDNQDQIQIKVAQKVERKKRAKSEAALKHGVRTKIEDILAQREFDKMFEL